MCDTHLYDCGCCCSARCVIILKGVYECRNLISKGLLNVKVTFTGLEMERVSGRCQEQQNSFLTPPLDTWLVAGFIVQQPGSVVVSSCHLPTNYSDAGTITPPGNVLILIRNHGVYHISNNAIRVCGC